MVKRWLISRMSVRSTTVLEVVGGWVPPLRPGTLSCSHSRLKLEPEDATASRDREW